MQVHSRQRDRRQPQGQSSVAFLPFLRITRIALRPRPFPADPKTVGEHLKATRLREGLLLKEAAKRFGVSPFTLSNWERGRTSPRVDLYGRVVAFLGVDPEASGTGLGAEMRAVRRRRGLSQCAASRELGVDPTTWSAWESGRRRPQGTLAARLAAFLAASLRPRASAATPRHRDGRIARARSPEDTIPGNQGS